MKTKLQTTKQPSLTTVGKFLFKGMRYDKRLIKEDFKVSGTAKKDIYR